MELPIFDISWLWTILLLLILFSTFSRYFNLSNSYWKKLGVPYIPRKPFVGSSLIFGLKDPHNTDLKRYKKYGRILGTYEGQQPVLVVAEPELIRQVWVKDFPAFPGRRAFTTGDSISDNMISVVNGEQWKRIRCVITPAFATGKIRKMTDIILTSAQTLAKNFASTNGAAVDAKHLYSTFTMDVIASTAFATKINSYQDPNNEFLQKARQIFTRTISWRLVLFTLFPQILRLFKIRIFGGRAMDFFKNAVLEIIEHRNRTGLVRNDFLQLLLDSEKELQEQEKATGNEEQKYEDDKTAEELGHEENNAQFLRAPKISKVLSRDELIAQCVIFFLAGFDTTASTLSFTSRLLALHPDIQSKLRDEIDTVIKNYDKKLTYDGVQEMKYLDYVLSETLRLFPPAIRIERMADTDYTLGDTGITINKGTVIAVPVYALHRDPEHFEDPEKFIPERFTPESKAKRHPYSYLPFGAGPRNCAAMRFALMEIKLCLAYVISQFNILESKDTKKPVEIFSGQGIMQPLNISIRFEKRTDRVFDGF